MISLICCFFRTFYIVNYMSHLWLSVLEGCTLNVQDSRTSRGVPFQRCYGSSTQYGCEYHCPNTSALARHVLYDVMHHALVSVCNLQVKASAMTETQTLWVVHNVTGHRAPCAITIQSVNHVNHPAPTAGVTTNRLTIL
jgi:hypothetical protein